MLHKPKPAVPLTMPVGDILVGNTGGNIKHDDTALAIDVVSIAETSELLLSCGIPDIKFNITQVLCAVSKVNEVFGGLNLPC
jgi:hypothetical protein